MITNLSNPNYSPETFAKVTIINFAITQSGLEDQMLSELIKIEMPELEENKNKILEENFISQQTSQMSRKQKQKKPEQRTEGNQKGKAKQRAKRKE